MAHIVTDCTIDRIQRFRFWEDHLFRLGLAKFYGIYSKKSQSSAN